ncbi:hypothetical protein GXP74_20700 [Streptacidiphilus sp. P02-A3a]|nr:hypothetical protein GXP74_20700 [Streptacidiphilus sp. P02-A3a]
MQHGGHPVLVRGQLAGQPLQQPGQHVVLAAIANSDCGFQVELSTISR